MVRWFFFLVGLTGMVLGMILVFKGSLLIGTGATLMCFGTFIRHGGDIIEKWNVTKP